MGCHSHQHWRRSSAYAKWGALAHSAVAAAAAVAVAAAELVPLAGLLAARCNAFDPVQE